MTDSALGKAVKKEYESLTAFQLSLYNDDANNDEDTVVMSTAPSIDIEKMAWDSNFSEIMKSTKITDNDGKTYVNYLLNKNCDKLRRLKMIIKTPQIELLEKFQENTRICFPDYPGYAIIEQAYLSNSDGDKIIDYLDTNRLLQHLDYNSRCRRRLLQEIGHVKELIEWTKMIPEAVLYVNQPWFYLNKGLPLVLTSDFQHKYRYRNQLEHFLRMQVRNGDDWVDIKPDLDRVTCKYNGIPIKSTKIEVPTLRAYYSVLTEAEKNKIIDDGRQQIIYSSVITNSRDIENKIHELNLNYDCASYCVMWCMRLKTDLEVNNYTSYRKLDTDNDNIVVRYEKDQRVIISARELLADADSYFENKPITNRQYYYHFGRDHDRRYIQSSTNTELSKVSVSFKVETTPTTQIDEYLYCLRQLVIERDNFSVITK